MTDLTPPDLTKFADLAPQENIRRLAAMHPLEYEKIRKEEANRQGCRQVVLDELVGAARTNMAAERRAGGLGIQVQEESPLPPPVDPSHLLDEIKATIQSFIVCEDEVATAGTLWVAFTWFIDVVQVAPLAVITAPEPRCGKTQFLDLLGRLARRPLLASNISPAAVFRVIEARQPTLLIDEADSFLKDNEELRGVINSGHTRQTAYVIRTVGDDHTPQQFSTWGAKALSGIGHLARTLMDRAVILELRRKLKSEKVQRLRHADPSHLRGLAAQLDAFANSASSAIQEARPDLPEELNDRAQDNWEPLLAIAAHVGGKWPQMARKAALKLAGVNQEPMSRAGQLLTDIREVFTQKHADKVGTADLIKALVSDDLKPWHTYDRGRPITPAQLARLLKDYGIRPKDLKFPGGCTLKGYHLDQFRDTFERYLDVPVGGSEPLPAHPEDSWGLDGCPSKAGKATTRDPQPDDVARGASPSATRNQGATDEHPPLLNGRGVAPTEGRREQALPVVETLLPLGEKQFEVDL